MTADPPNEAARLRNVHNMLLVHQFGLPRISGLTVTVAELVRLIPEVDIGVAASCLSYDEVDDVASLVAALGRDHHEATCVVGFNLHIEVGWEHTVAVAGWCAQQGIPLFLYVHDYWPHHRDGVAELIARFGAQLLAITPAIVSDLAAHGFAAQLLPAGVAIPAERPTQAAGRLQSGPKTVAAVGRLVPRKRFADVVGGFCRAELGAEAALHLRLIPSLVYTCEQDRQLLAEVCAEQAHAATSTIEIDVRPRIGTDYRPWDLYVSASEYEGVSMTPLESILHGCPFVLSDIPPHRNIVEALFPQHPEDFLFPLGDRTALAGLIRHELSTGERRAEASARSPEIHEVIGRTWSLANTANRLVRLVDGGDRTS